MQLPDYLTGSVDNVNRTVTAGKMARLTGDALLIYLSVLVLQEADWLKGKPIPLRPLYELTGLDTQMIRDCLEELGRMGLVVRHQYFANDYWVLKEG